MQGICMESSSERAKRKMRSIFRRNKARMLFKRWKAGMEISEEEKKIVRRYYPFVR